MDMCYDINSALRRRSCFGKAQEMLKYMRLKSSWIGFSVSFSKYDVTDMIFYYGTSNPSLFRLLFSLKAMF